MFKCWINMSMLAAEAQQVIWLRTMKLALGGPGVHREVRRMVTEKVTAANKATGKLMAGSSANSVVQVYRRKVRSNARRLSK